MESVVPDGVNRTAPPEATDSYKPVSHFVLANTLATIRQDLKPGRRDPSV